MKASGEARKGLMKKLDLSRIKRLKISNDIEKYVEIIKDERADFLIGMPSYLKIIAKTAIEQGITGVKSKVIVSCGEVLDEASRTYLGSSFESEVYNGYGCIEIAPLGMAWECRERSGLHINSDVAFLEFLKNGESISPGEKGEVVATSLFRYATPMIRYRVGDIATLSEDTCPCGRKMPLIRNIEERIVDFLKMPDGRLISPYYVMSAIQYIHGIAKYQIMQESQDRIVVTIEKGKDFAQKTIEQLRDACLELFGSNVLLEVNVIESFSIKKGKKFRVFESRMR